MCVITKCVFCLFFLSFLVTCLHQQYHMGEAILKKKNLWSRIDVVGTVYKIKAWRFKHIGPFFSQQQQRFAQIFKEVNAKYGLLRDKGTFCSPSHCRRKCHSDAAIPALCDFVLKSNFVSANSSPLTCHPEGVDRPAPPIWLLFHMETQDRAKK